jgi:hypothetical protein
MTDFESGSLHTHGQAVALIATYYKASYSRLLGLVRKRFRSLDPEEMVQALFVKILDQVDAISADDPEALGSLMDRWTTPGYTTRSLIHFCLDAVGSGPISREDATDPLRVPRWRAAMTSAQIPPTSTGSATSSSTNLQACTHRPRTKSPLTLTLTSRQAVNAILQTLLERGRRRRSPHSHH